MSIVWIDKKDSFIFYVKRKMKIGETSNQLTVWQVIDKVNGVVKDKKNVAVFASEVIVNPRFGNAICDALSMENPTEPKEEWIGGKIGNKLTNLGIKNGAIYAVVEFCEKNPQYQQALRDNFKNMIVITKKERPKITIRRK